MYRQRHIKGKLRKIKPQTPLLKRLEFWIVLFVTLGTFSVFYFVYFFSGFQINNIVVSGNQMVQKSDLQKFIESDVTKKIVNLPFFKITSKSIFLTGSRSLSKAILTTFPPIESVQVKRIFPNTLAINTTERKSLGIYCQDQYDNCFLIDGNGIIFERFEGYPHGITVVRQADEKSNVFTGEQIINQEIMSAISKIQKNLKDNLQVNLKEAMITSPVRLDVLTSENWKIYFNLSQDSDINTQLLKLNLLLKQEVPENQRTNLEYINLMTKDKAIICDNKTCAE
jgi:cell division septal protein FtsQ